LNCWSLLTRFLTILKDAWTYIERFTIKFELSEVIGSCFCGAHDIEMMAFSPKVGSDGWTALTFSHCAIEINVSLN
jgi:hypothetical protein